LSELSHYQTFDKLARASVRPPLKRMLGPKKSRLVLFLAADDGAAITSQSNVIDGGWV
jgi:hypothetical protein